MDPNQPPPMPATDLADANARPDPPQSYYPLPDGSPPLANTQWSAETAKRVVLNDFNRAAAWRATNIETQWQEMYDVYVAARGANRTWEGTGNGTPRANLQVHQAFQQINALRPQMLDALTGSDLDFDVEPAKAGTTVSQTKQVRSLMEYQLKSLGGMVKFQTFRSCLDRLSEDGLIFGNGLWEWGWDGPRTVQVVKWERFAHPEYAQIPHPLVPGMAVNVPTGRMTQTNLQRFQDHTISQFFLDPIDLTDFYIDPNCRGSNAQLADFCVRRKMMTIQDLAALRGQPGWDIPSDIELYALSRRKTFTEGDTTFQWMQSASGINAWVNQDQSMDPRLARIEVLRYWQKGKHVWLLGRSHVAWNDVNQYQALPVFNWCYVNKPGAFYGFSIPELLRSPQAYIRELLNGRADELAIILHPPFISKAGTFRSQSQSRFGPGKNMEVQGDPSKDLIRMEMGNVTQQAFIEVNAAETRAQQVTGVTDLASLGTPSTGGNSANRTATGVQAQTTASNTRVHGLVANIEDTVVGPMLEQMWELDKMYMNPQQVMEIVGSDGNILQLDPVDLLNSDPRFKMKTANNMKMRAAMQNGGLAQLTQYVLNPEILTLTAEQQGQVLDIGQFTEFYLDVYGVKSFSLFRPMSPQEQQALQAKQQQGGQEKMALQNARLQAMSADAREADDTKLIVSIIAGLAQAGLLNKVAGLPHPVELEAKRLEAEIEGGMMEQQPTAQ